MRRGSGRRETHRKLLHVFVGGSENVSWGDGHRQSKGERWFSCALSAEPLHLSDGLASGLREEEDLGNLGLALHCWLEDAAVSIELGACLKENQMSSF